MTPTTLDPRSRFLAVLHGQPLRTGDAVVVLAGEDCGPRIATAMEVRRQGAAPGILVTGGRHDPPRWMGATEAAKKLCSEGEHPSLIAIDETAQNTHEQAVNTVRRAKEKGWTTLLLVASAYHMPRAFLTFVKALKAKKLERKIRLVAVPASHMRWNEAPEGMDTTRLELLDVEAEKVEQYAEHVASYEEGLEYLLSWEGPTPAPARAEPWKEVAL